MKRLNVIAPKAEVAELRKMARKLAMWIYQDGKYLKLKGMEESPVFERAQATLPEGSFQIYASDHSGSYGKPAYRSLNPDSIRIRIK